MVELYTFGSQVIKDFIDLSVVTGWLVILVLTARSCYGMYQDSRTRWVLSVDYTFRIAMLVGWLGYNGTFNTVYVEIFLF